MDNKNTNNVFRMTMVVLVLLIVIYVISSALTVLFMGLALGIANRTDPYGSSDSSSVEYSVPESSESIHSSEVIIESYPAETLPDYEVHTLPSTTEAPTTEEPTTEEPSSEEPTTAEPETTVPDTTTAEGTSEALETTAEPVSTEPSTEFSENSDNLAYIGTWHLEYDLAPAQADAVSQRYSLPRMPERRVILRLSAELHDDGTIRLVFAQEDADAFKTALNGWYSDCASIYAESGAGTVQKAAFASWAAYRKGLYALLSPDTVNRVKANWYAEGNTIYVTDEGVVQAEITTAFAADGLTVTDFTIRNPDYRDTVALMQSSLGFTAPYHLTKD